MSSSVSIFDIARAAGVSISTVFRTINGKTEGIRISQSTRQRILAIAQHLGYRPDPAARNVALGKPYSGAKPQGAASDPKFQMTLNTAVQLLRS